MTTTPPRPAQRPASSRRANRAAATASAVASDRPARTLKASLPAQHRLANALLVRRTESPRPVLDSTALGVAALRPTALRPTAEPIAAHSHAELPGAPSTTSPSDLPKAAA